MSGPSDQPGGGGAPRPIVVVGATGTGKSEVGVALARHCAGVVINCDAMQLYRGMDVGTAKLSLAERQGIEHRQLDIWPVTRTASVAEYQRGAALDVERLRAEGRRPIIVGGSMLYIQSLIDQWQFPDTDPEVRARWEQRLEQVGVAALHTELRAADPVAAETILDTDSRRIVRALEVIELTGKPFGASKPEIGAPRWDALMLGLSAPTAWLDPRLELRVRRMFERGLVAEVERLIPLGLREGVTARRAIGYGQVLDYLDGATDLATAHALTVQATRRYSRRQRSWFRRDPRIEWLSPHEPDVVGQALARVEAAL